MSDKLNIEQLFNSKLGEGEITPSPGAWKGIRRKLRWKKFLRFHPGQFNIFYLGGALIVGTVLVVKLTSTTPEITPASGAENPEMSSGTVVENQGEPSAAGNLTESAQEHTRDIAPSVSGSAANPNEIDQRAAKPASVTGQESQTAGLEAASSGEEINQDNLTDNSAQDSDLNTGQTPGQTPVQNPTQNLSIVAPLKTTSNTLVTYYTASVQSGCAPLSVQFQNQSVNAESYEWTLGSDAKSNDRDPVHVFNEAGQYTVSLTARNMDGQSSIYQQVIEVHPDPRADFQVEEGFEGIDGHVSLNLINYSSGANNYSWSLLDKNANVSGSWSSVDFEPALKLTDLDPGSESISLEVSNEFGCIHTAIQELPIEVESSDIKMKFATAFSPNPTGPGGGTFSPHEKRIDLFHPIFFEVPVEYSLKVYTKRGEIIFETREIYQGWDGYFHQQRSAGGVYVWIAEGTWGNGETFNMQGDVTLIWQDIW